MAAVAQERALTDAELQAVFADKFADLSLLSADEQQRLLKLTAPEAQTATPTGPFGRAAVGQGLLETAKGMAKGVVSSIRQGGEALRSIPGVGPALSRFDVPFIDPKANNPAQATGMQIGETITPEPVAPAVAGMRDLSQGRFARGGVELATAAGKALLPAGVTAAVRAPLQAAATVAGGALTGAVAERGATALGATPDQAALAGVVGNVAGGVAAYKSLPVFQNGLRIWSNVRAGEAIKQSFAQFAKAIPGKYTEEQFFRARNYLDQEHATNPIESPADVVRAAKPGIAQIEDAISQAAAVNPTDRIAVNPHQAVMDELRAQNKGSTQYLKDAEAWLKDYPELNGKPTVIRADDLRRNITALDTKFDPTTSSGKVAAVQATLDVLRSGVYDQLEARGMTGVADLRRDEGALLKITSAAAKVAGAGEKTVAGTGGAGRYAARIGARMTGAAVGAELAGGSGAVGGALAGELAAERFLPSNMTRNALLKRSFKTSIGQPVTMPTAQRGVQAAQAEPISATLRGNVASSAVSAGTAPARDLPVNRIEERAPVATPGLQSPGSREAGRPVLEAPDTPADADPLSPLIRKAQREGYRGDPAALKTELQDRLQLIQDLDTEFEHSGRNPTALLKAIRGYGGISEQAETGMKGEIRWLKEFQDNIGGTAIKPRTQFGTIGGVQGVIRKGGLTLDGMVEALRQEPRFEHIQSLSDLIEEISHAARAGQPDSALDRLEEHLPQGWWKVVK